MKIPDCFKPDHDLEQRTEDLLEGRLIKTYQDYEDDTIAYEEVTYSELTPERLDNIIIPDDKIKKVEVRLKGRGWFEYHNRPPMLNDPVCLITCYSAIGASKREASFLFRKVKMLSNVKHKLRLERINRDSESEFLRWYFKANFARPLLKKQDVKKILTGFIRKEAKIVYENVTKREYRDSYSKGKIEVKPAYQGP